MSKPSRTLFWMALYLTLVSVVCALLYEPLKQAFLANWVFNSLILATLFIGIVINVRHVLVLEPELNWIHLFRTGQAGLSVTEEPRLLRPLAKNLEGRVNKDRFSLSALSLRTVLDGIRARLDESREISRYMIGLLIFLGLLGTFWGLLGTIGAVGKVIAGLEVGARDFSAVFVDLKAGLQEPLQGMGTAFSSSLFGLGGSLILGFLDIQAGHAQNRFFNSLEEWLSGLTQLVDIPESVEEMAARARVTEDRGRDRELAALVAEIRAQRELLSELVKERGSERQESRDSA